jgi:hypothetical protein
MDFQLPVIDGPETTLRGIDPNAGPCQQLAASVRLDPNRLNEFGIDTHFFVDVRSKCGGGHDHWLKSQPGQLVTHLWLLQCFEASR